MQLIAIKDIKRGDRIRKAFDENKLGLLSDSIARLGLLHAPILQDGVLVCGERRLKAIGVMKAFNHQLTYQGVDVPEGHVPYTNLGTSTINAIMEAELEENLMREDLSVHEEAAARANLHRLRVEQNPEHTIHATAQELSKPGKRLYTMDIRDAILIEEYATDTDVSKAKSTKEAMKIIAKKKRDSHNEDLAEEFHRTTTESPHTLVATDMVDWLAACNDKEFDVICTDPPYGIDAQDFNAQEGVTHVYEDSREIFERIIGTIAVQGFRVCKAGAHAYVFHDYANWEFIRSTMESAGWRVWPRPIIWSKGNGLLARPNHGPRYTYECILFASKGDKPVTHVAPDVISVRTLTRQRRGAEKPVAVYLDLLARSIQPGDSVLDPCCGLGPIFPAANELSCRATGLEIDPTAIGYASARMNLSIEEDEAARQEDLATRDELV